MFAESLKCQSRPRRGLRKWRGERRADARPEFAAQQAAWFPGVMEMAKLVVGTWLPRAWLLASVACALDDELRERFLSNREEGSSIEMNRSPVATPRALAPRWGVRPVVDEPVVEPALFELEPERLSVSERPA